KRLSFEISSAPFDQILWRPECCRIQESSRGSLQSCRELAPISLFRSQPVKTLQVALTSAHLLARLDNMFRSVTLWPADSTVCHISYSLCWRILPGSAGTNTSHVSTTSSPRKTR